MSKELIKYGALLVGGIYLINKIFDKPGQTTLELPYDPEKLTYPPYWYTVTADQLQEAIWNNDGFNEDDDKIRDLLCELFTDDDFIKLSKDFGLRSGQGMWALQKRTLPQALIWLDNSHKAEVNEVWESRGITFRL
jgi:hypothetical protein